MQRKAKQAAKAQEEGEENVNDKPVEPKVAGRQKAEPKAKSKPNNKAEPAAKAGGKAKAKGKAKKAVVEVVDTPEMPEEEMTEVPATQPDPILAEEDADQMEEPEEQEEDGDAERVQPRNLQKEFASCAIKAHNRQMGRPSGGDLLEEEIIITEGGASKESATENTKPQGKAAAKAKGKAKGKAKAKGKVPLSPSIKKEMKRRKIQQEEFMQSQVSDLECGEMQAFIHAAIMGCKDLENDDDVKLYLKETMGSKCGLARMSEYWESRGVGVVLRKGAKHCGHFSSSVQKYSWSVNVACAYARAFLCAACRHYRIWFQKTNLVGTLALSFVLPSSFELVQLCCPSQHECILRSGPAYRPAQRASSRLQGSIFGLPSPYVQDQVQWPPSHEEAGQGVCC